MAAPLKVDYGRDYRARDRFHFFAPERRGRPGRSRPGDTSASGRPQVRDWLTAQRPADEAQEVATIVFDTLRQSRAHGPLRHLAGAAKVREGRILADMAVLPPAAHARVARAAQRPVHEPMDGLSDPACGAVLRALPVRGRARRGQAGGLPRDRSLRRHINPVVDLAGAISSSPGRRCGTCSSASTASSRWACATRSPSSCRSSARSSSRSR